MTLDSHKGAKTILITGATDGLGRGVAHALAGQGHTLLLHGRSQQRLDAVAGPLDTTVRTYRADLASLQAIRGLTEELLASEDRIDVLLANAGIGGGARQESVDGYELHFAVNYLSQSLLVTGLLRRLRASAPARIVLVSSLGQAPIDFDDVMLEHNYDGMRAYGQSKLAQASRADNAQWSTASLCPTIRLIRGRRRRRQGERRSYDGDRLCAGRPGSVFKVAATTNRRSRTRRVPHPMLRSCRSPTSSTRRELPSSGRALSSASSALIVAETSDCTKCSRRRK